jgi:hypothetical protein
MCRIAVAYRHLAIGLDNVRNGLAKAHPGLVEGPFLGQRARQFLNGADPPFAILLKNRGVGVCHGTSFANA